ncbi:MAG: DUF2738 domain-containing protein, partial [Planctomycetota bacterium]
YRKDDKFGTVFFSPVDGTEIDPKSIIGTRCDVKAAIKIDNIYVGRDVRLQIKILEGAVEPRSTGKKQWLARPTASKILEPTSDSTSSGLMGVNNDDDAGSLAASSDEEEEEVKPVEKPKPAAKKKKIIKRRVVKR